MDLLFTASSEAGMRTALIPPTSEMDPVAASSEGTDNLANGVLEMIDARQKMQYVYMSFIKFLLSICYKYFVLDYCYKYLLFLVIKKNSFSFRKGE
jgi:hypothetical protein